MVSCSSKTEKREKSITHKCWRKYLASLEGSHREVKTECMGMTQRDVVGREVGGGFKKEVIYIYLWLIYVEV